MRDLAQRLLALEAGRRTATDAHAHEAPLVLGKLRVSLARFAGPDGFASLQRRALTLAREEHPALQDVSAKDDGSLEGFEAVVIEGGSDAASAVIAQLLGLLVTLVGESITLRLVRDAWPEARLSH